MQQLADIALSVGVGSFLLLIIVMGLNVIFHPEESRLTDDEIYQERIRKEGE
ncbi:hypothetical protein [Oceanispirochaeta sp.]|jgi:anaerobic C4-dicarboxylate transporter|uniref:hypothetical protein n=1 Tax=Oceanispirochaeta sp. TaxID=2035350 RepID=UPI00261A7C10|nr:hypothetical protein [Oceanispirochaeta sp.]MDA3956879.1 hypothetical protein [Oceanispirochaeta sp.]